MSKESVIKFMEGADLYPDITGMHSSNSKANAELIKKAALRLIEEAQELYDAVADTSNPDWKEAFDGLLDCLYVGTQLNILFNIYGFDVSGGLEEVCDNNAIKIYNSEEHAILEWARWEEQNPGYVVIHPSASSEGQVFTLRRVEDGKVMKAVDHPKPDLLQYMPEEFKKEDNCFLGVDVYEEEV